MRFAGSLLISFLALSCTSSQKPSFTESAFSGSRAIAAKRPPGGTRSTDYHFNPRDTSCGGWPRLAVGTMPGTCLGFVLSGREHGLKMPRTLLQLPGSNDFLLVDMGGWIENGGALYLMQMTTGEPQLIKLREGLNTPHGLAIDGRGRIYLGESHQVIRFELSTTPKIEVKSWRVIVKGLPRFKGHMHPLTQIALDPNSGDLYVNSGAPSDHCFVKEYQGYVDCPESVEKGMGAVYRYPAVLIENPLAGGVQLTEMFAQGLRNSMALTVAPSGLVIQGENSRDFKELEEPYEEINVLDPQKSGLNYGWPQCYNFHALSPEWLFEDVVKSPLREKFHSPLDCSTTVSNDHSLYQRPHALMPPHAAPLHMNYYQGNLLPSLRGKLLVSWHGYQPTGHRLVAYNVDAQGKPQVVSGEATYSMDQSGRCPKQVKFNPRGRMVQHAPYTEVISRWDEVKGQRPKGTPVGFAEAHDGSVFIVEDKNLTIVRLAPYAGREQATACEVQTNGDDPRMVFLAWRQAMRANPRLDQLYQDVKDNVIERHCSACHGGFKETDINDDEYQTLDWLTKNSWIVEKNPDQSRIYAAVAQTGDYPSMPPEGEPISFKNDQERKQALTRMSNWINALPENIQSFVTKIEIGSARKIRNLPGTANTECGRIEAGDTIYVDPRPENRITTEGWQWSPIYLLKNDSRLFEGICPYPKNGVYYLALKKI